MTEVALFRGPTNLASSASRGSSSPSPSSSSPRYLADSDVLQRRSSSTNAESPAAGSAERQAGGSEQEDGERWSFLALLLELLRKSFLGCRVEGGAGDGGMEIGLPTDVQHVAHVTFDRFHGFLGLPVEFEPEVPRRAPSARKVHNKGKITDKARTPTLSTTTRTYRGAPPQLLHTDLGNGEVPRADGKSTKLSSKEPPPCTTGTVALLRYISTFRNFKPGPAAPRRPARESTHRSSRDLRACQGRTHRSRTQRSSTTGEDVRRHKTPLRPCRHLLDAVGWLPTRS